MLELQKKILSAQAPKEEAEKPKPETTDELFNKYFYGRAWEVYRAAKQQYPEAMEKIEKALQEAIKAGKIKEKISGEALYTLFNQIGMRVRLETTIMYKKHGELKTIEQTLKERD